MFSKLIYSIRYRLNKLNNQTISGTSNRVICNGRFIGCDIQINGDSNIIEIGKNSVLSNVKITLKGNNSRIKICDNVRIKSGELWLEDNDCLLHISDFVSIEEAHLSVTENNSILLIGEDSMLANGIEIRTGDSHAIFNTDGKRINSAKNVTIGQHVWIGSKATILKGVQIGNNAIISTGAVVTSDVPANSICAGIPARVIKENINWTRDRNNK